ncbi:MULTISPECIES: YjzD family protein [Pontibacillus]|uniref:YjzD family protein n=1 Tax=Pontibacillus chungwhensis TaxID=265426 RepID=A0ABY8V077_9BACI|nr:MULTISPECIES: YjzD family protein [Pontibacillus]MCD5324702.1 YjzD family protein [Pontibacillus sp. HN14]WIF99005.1 YjzD family protein [Pontibacillus chungwhensis]
MRLIWSIIWSFLLSCMTVYVVNSMDGLAFNMTQAIVLTIGFTVAVVLLGEGALAEDKE